MPINKIDMNVVLASLNQPQAARLRLREILQHLGRPDSIETYQRLVPGVAVGYGTPMQVLKEIATALIKAGRQNPAETIAFLDILWDAGILEERQIVGKVLEKMGKWHPELCFQAIKRYLKSLDGWANCDNLACFAMKEIVARNPAKILNDCEHWISSPNRWIRRFGVVVLRAFEKIDAPQQVFQLLGSLSAEKDKDVQKALAWMLRDLSRKHQQQIFQILCRFAKLPQGQVGALVMREGMKKLSTDYQQQIQLLLRSRS